MFTLKSAVISYVRIFGSVGLGLQCICSTYLRGYLDSLEVISLEPFRELYTYNSTRRDRGMEDVGRSRELRKKAGSLCIWASRLCGL